MKKLSLFNSKHPELKPFKLQDPYESMFKLDNIIIIQCAYKL